MYTVSSTSAHNERKIEKTKNKLMRVAAVCNLKVKQKLIENAFSATVIIVSNLRFFFLFFIFSPNETITMVD